MTSKVGSGNLDLVIERNKRKKVLTTAGWNSVIVACVWRQIAEKLRKMRLLEKWKKELAPDGIRLFSLLMTMTEAPLGGLCSFSNLQRLAMGLTA